MSVPDDPARVAARGPELAVSAFLLTIGVLVVADSLRVGIGWAEDGPRAGYFPFYIGLLLLASSGAVFVGQLLRWRRDTAVFAERAQLRQVVSVLLPIAVYVGAIFPLGIYVASAVLIAFFMRRHGRYRWIVTAALALAVPLSFFVVFERWFLVPLPKGPLERLFGL